METDKTDNEESRRILPDTLEKYYEDIVRTALAISIIRTKPQHMSGKVYAQVLNTSITGNVKHWRSKAQALEEELLSVKEELIRAKFPLPVEDSGSSHNIEDEDTADMDTMECLTPPCSSESKSDKRQSKDVGNSHAKFLKSIVSLWDAPRSAAMLKDTQLSFHLFTTVLQAVTVLKERIHDSDFAETSIPECCVDSLIGVLDMDIHAQQTVETVFHFACEIISAVMNHEICSSNFILYKYSKLIIQLASHKKITKLVLSKLTEQLVTFSNTLRTISQDPMTLQGNLEKYNSIYYILWCTENILLKTKEDDSLQSVSKSLMTTLEDSVLHLSKTFPLFTCFVWRIGGLISAQVSGQNMDVEP